MRGCECVRIHAAVAGKKRQAGIEGVNEVTARAACTGVLQEVQVLGRYSCMQQAKGWPNA